MKTRTHRRHETLRTARQTEAPLDTEALKSQLVAIRDRILQRVDHVDGDLNALHDQESPAEMEEGAQEQHIADILRRLGDRDRHELAAVDAALGRISAGGYGVCTTCEEPIPPARLEVLPTANSCVECAEKAARAPRPVPVEFAEAALD